MELFYAREASYIKLLGWEHFFYMSLILFLVFVLLTQRRRLYLYQDALTRIILGFSIFQQVLLYAWYFFETGFDLAEALPLHLCRISSVLGIVYLITKKSLLMDVVFYYGLYAYASFAYPQAIYAPYHLLGISYLLNHTITLILPIVAYYAFNWRPKIEGLVISILSFLIYFVIAYFVNIATGGNYFYLTDRPFFHALPAWQFNTLAVVVSILGFCLAYWLLSGRKKSVYFKR
ncbi:MAG TPA: TIGR02206 family membrane protein [Erysipelotrichaceae bacterium]|nr:TIGR02206 family membrane protein [Erysipelotrichaceae bacterium]